ncbi:MAG: hypothetical protein DWQ53_25000 [Microcystis flos-aquae DF17]|nr:MAG: hypothetical protein DWQ53_25000 [Microcystis flos-aquae DF17]
MPEKVWVLGTRTPAWVGKVRLAIFRGRKRIPLKREALNDLESSSHTQPVDYSILSNRRVPGHHCP